MSKRGEILALGDPSPSAAWWLLASPGAAAVGSGGALLSSEWERVGAGTARVLPGSPKVAAGAPWRVELVGAGHDCSPQDHSAHSAALMGLKLDWLGLQSARLVRSPALQEEPWSRSWSEG